MELLCSTIFEPVGLDGRSFRIVSFPFLSSRFPLLMQRGTITSYQPFNEQFFPFAFVVWELLKFYLLKFCVIMVLQYQVLALPSWASLSLF